MFWISLTGTVLAIGLTYKNNLLWDDDGLISADNLIADPKGFYGVRESKSTCEKVSEQLIRVNLQNNPCPARKHPSVGRLCLSGSLVVG